MKKHLTKIFAVLFAVLIATSLSVLPTPVIGQTTTAQEKAIDFIENMLPIDLSKYNIKLVNDYTTEDVLSNGVTRKQNSVTYELTAENRELRISFVFERGSMTLCFLSTVEGQVITNTQYNNPVDATKAFLEKHQTYTNIDSKNLIAMLENVDINKDSIITTENTKLTIKNDYWLDRYQTTFTWVQVINSVEYPGISLEFDKEGNFLSIYDTRALYKIGDTSVNISLEQAVDIAIENLKSYSYAMPDGSIVKDFKVSKDAVMVSLEVSPIDYVNYELRPYYDVRLYLDEVYPGNVFGITAFIWANNGEIISYSNMASGGIDNLDNTNTTALTSNSNTLILGISIVAIMAVAATGILVAKKRSK